MIVVFVIDTSPSMSKHIGVAGSTSSGNGMTRLDLAKMMTEEIVRGLKKRVFEHNTQLQQVNPKLQESLCNIGLGYAPKDELLLLSTGRQHPNHAAAAACGAGGRLLVGFGDHLADENSASGNNAEQQSTTVSNQHHGIDSFQRELKQLTATEWRPTGPQQLQQGNKPTPFPEDGGGAMGLNAALSAGLQMLSRYRLRFRVTENFGMGRLPSTAILNPSGGGTAFHALQPACLILITDGECLRSPVAEGGGSLKLSSSTLLKEFYQEPFRWDQRIFVVGVGGKDGITSAQFLHPQLRALCEVTGGSHVMLKQSSLSQCSDMLLKLLAPPRPRDLPLLDPVEYPIVPTPLLKGANGTFVNGGPVCSFQALEPDADGGKTPPKNRAMLLYVPQNTGNRLSGVISDTNNDIGVFQPPVWCIPETFFPKKTLETLPPRSAEPTLLFSRFPSRLGSRCFEASSVMKMLSKLDQIILATRNLSIAGTTSSNQQSGLLKRDLYVCEWISAEGKEAKGPASPPGVEYFPVLVAGAGRDNLSSGETNYLSIGILHVPPGTSSLASSLSTGVRLSTLTLLPPEPHILLPILIRAAETEHRAIKKAASSIAGTSGLSQKQTLSISRNIQLDENWRKELKAYMFRLPPYYQNALKRSLRAVLPSSAYSLLNTEDVSLPSQCFSKECQQKIRNAEQIAKATNERLERQEAELRRRGMPVLESARVDQQQSGKSQSLRRPPQTEAEKMSTTIKYGQYDPKSSIESYLAALPNMPAPWKSSGQREKDAKKAPEGDVVDSSSTYMDIGNDRGAVDIVRDLPAKCLMAFYESRRRWIFGGSGLATRGLYVEGVNNDGSNVQHCQAKRDIMSESLLSSAGVGVSQLNATSTAKMGDYRERLLWSRAPVVGTGANDSMGVSATTSQNGAPVWSVDDDAMPVAFFDARTGTFSDSVQARVRSRLFVNFGNPYKDKRADSLIPDQFLSQRPKLRSENDDDSGPLTPPASPPRDSYAATEGEGEAVFATSGIPVSRRSPRKSPSRNEDESTEGEHLSKRPKMEAEIESKSIDKKLVSKPPPPPPPTMKSTGNEEIASTAPNPPPPPPRRQSGAPPPPPVRQAQQTKVSLQRNQARPPPPSTGPTNAPGGSEAKRPPPPSQGGSKDSTSKPLPPPQSISAPPASSTAQQPGPECRNSISQSGPPAGGVDMQSPEKKPNVALPPGWMCVWSKSQRRWYFFDRKTNKSVWQWPPP